MSSSSSHGSGLSRNVLALVLAGFVGAGCAASTDDEVGDTGLERDSGTEQDGATDDASPSEDGGITDEDSGSDDDAGLDDDAGDDLDSGDGGDEDPNDGGFDDDADVPPTDSGSDVDPGGAVCGDFKVEGDEECDDGNTQNGDGCDENCRIEVPPTEYGTCPGKEIILTGTGNETRKGGISGSTTLLQATYTATCSGASPSGKDAVFHVKPDVDGRLTARVTQASFDEILYGRTNCTATGSTSLLQCSASSTAQGGEVISFPVQKNVPYFLFVDSKDQQTHGSFTLEVEVTPGKCGNGVIDFGEKCDDGNTTRGDGCDENCQLETAPTRNACPGEQLLLTGNPPSAKVTHGNVNLSSSYTAATGTACYVSSSKDAVYQVTPAIDGRLVAKMKANYDASIYARTSSCTSSTAANQLACSNSQPAGGEEVISFPVTKQTPYWLIVETHDGQHGIYDLEVTVHPAQCGNNVRDGNEECDGDDVPAGFLCDTDCTLWRATDDKCPGEPLAFFGPEGGPYTAYIDGDTTNYFDDALSSTCHATSGAAGLDATYQVTPPIDGSLSVTVRSLAFDAVVYARSNCASQASEISCVNASNNKNLPEQLTIPVQKGVPVTLVVDGNTEKVGGAFTLDAVLNPAVCGNGILDGNEECDDGNAINGDGCSTACKLEPLPNINTCPGHELTLAPAGNGYVASITASTAHLANKYNTACSSQSYGPEAIFQVTSPIAGKLTATVTSNFNAAVYHHAACLPTSSPSCSNKSTGTGPETHTFNVSAGSTYYLYVDGISTGGGPDSGVFKLDVAITP